MTKRAAILHPSLGFGGAEKVTLQISAALRGARWRTTVLVNDYDPARSFPETAEETITVLPSRIPVSLGGYFKSWCAYFRMRAALPALRKIGAPDLCIVDLLPHMVPALKAAFPRMPVLVYCHFPDRLLAPAHPGPLRRFHRACFDALERKGLEAADRLAVNSAFTRQRLESLYPTLAHRAEVIHPAVRIPEIYRGENIRNYVLSLGRIHPSKNHILALETFAAAGLPVQAQLVIAGGIDDRDRACLAEREVLEKRTLELGIGQRVVWRFNAGEEEMERLWEGAGALLHPAVAEHFGLAPLEAMSRGVPVIAVDAGGPRETIEHGKSGLLVGANGREMGAALREIWEDGEMGRRFSREGRERVAREFSEERFAAQIVGLAEKAVAGRSRD